jgi:Holliday junction resolvase RusA-like endonuclease
MIKIVLLWKPQSTQNSYGQRGKIRYMKKEAKEVKIYYIEQIQEQYKWPVIEWPVIVSIDLYRSNNLRRDRDNRHKISMDAMEWIVFKDDTQIQQAIVTKHKWDERIELTITEL